MIEFDESQPEQHQDPTTTPPIDHDTIVVHPEIRYTLEIRGARITECMKCDPAEGVRVWRGMLEMAGRRQAKPCQIITLTDGSLTIWQHLFDLELEGEKVLAATPNLFERIKELRFEEIAADETGNPPDDVAGELEQLKTDGVLLEDLTTMELIRLSGKGASACIDELGKILTGGTLREHLIEHIREKAAGEVEVAGDKAEGLHSEPLTCTVCGNPMLECIGAEDCIAARQAEDLEEQREPEHVPDGGLEGHNEGVAKGRD